MELLHLSLPPWIKEWLLTDIWLVFLALPLTLIITVPRWKKLFYYRFLQCTFLSHMTSYVHYCAKFYISELQHLNIPCDNLKFSSRLSLWNETVIVYSKLLISKNSD